MAKGSQYGRAPTGYIRRRFARLLLKQINPSFGHLDNETLDERLVDFISTLKTKCPTQNAAEDEVYIECLIRTHFDIGKAVQIFRTTRPVLVRKTKRFVKEKSFSFAFRNRPLSKVNLVKRMFKVLCLIFVNNQLDWTDIKATRALLKFFCTPKMFVSNRIFPFSLPDEKFRLGLEKLRSRSSGDRSTSRKISRRTTCFGKRTKLRENFHWKTSFFSRFN